MTVEFGVLGPLVATRDGAAIDLGGPRQRAVVARLVLAKGRVVPLPRLIDDLWEEPPENAVGTIRTFVFALRRALEPDRPPRSPARLLITSAPGYALRAEPGSVDAWRFEAAVTARDVTLSGLDDALALWRGPAYAEFADEPWARAEIDRLDELRLLAVERRAEAALALGRADAVVPDLEAHLAERPWREAAWRLLVLALYRAGRQGDALDALRRAKKILAAELGVDPGPELRQLEADVLAHAPHLMPRQATDVVVVPPSTDERSFVGRDTEIADLRAAAATARAHGKLSLALVSGEAGSGKTTLAETFSERLAAEGWTTAWGRNPEHAGAPAAWPWTELLTALAVPAAEAPDGSPAFRRRQAIGAALSTAAAKSPLLLVLDDLHWADEETLATLTALAAAPVPGPILLVGTYRTTEISAELTAALGRVARAGPVRIHLGGLSEADVAELLSSTAHHDVGPDLARTVRHRTGGNPFFVTELARLLDAEGPEALTSVPAGVRDVVRHRLGTLPESALTTLRQAAVIGLELDLDLLIPLSGKEDDVLDDVESALLAGFLFDDDGVRFSHALVRDTLYEDISRPRRARWHAAVAETLERLRPTDFDALARHFLRAEGRSAAARAARYARAAAEQAERRFAPHEAARLWRDAVEAHDRSGADDPRVRLDAVMGMVRALAVTGRLESARTHRAAAITAAERLGDPALTARVITAFDVPAIWTRNDDPDLSRQVVDAAERTLSALPPEETEQRCRLLSTIALELRGMPDDRGPSAAAEAETLARRLGDPGLLAYALNARFMQSFTDAGLAPARAEIGRELVELAARHELVPFEVLGHLILLQSSAALADFAAADRHAQAADALGERHELPLVSVFTDWYAALKLAAAGHSAEAEAAYRTAAVQLPSTGMRGVEDGLLALALLCLRVQDGQSVVDTRDYGPYEPWARPVLLLASDRRDEAAAAVRDLPDSPRDLLYEARLCLAAVAALGVGDKALARNTYDDLLPAAEELAGAGSGLVTLGPVAQYLADLADALGLADEAAAHLEQAHAVQTRVRAMTAAD
ncbi:BTAD domain-containing putative transcriptional regulator [Amycolatopsis sp. NPDC059021]|uniref:BTAD domain-containing putative transcriptional regulator n=1 Tax=Amycolatopsis sp. NPDC059021 TaxID=3346704 RepID=UPI00366EA4D5